MKSYVYGIERNDGFFWNFTLNKFTVWCPQCSLPSEQLAHDLHLMLVEEIFDQTKVVSVPTEE